MKEFWRMGKEEVLKELGVSQQGLAGKDVESRKEKYGENILEEAHKKSILRIFVEQFADLLVAILVVAAIISAVSGSVESTIVIIVVLIMNAILGTVQYVKAEKSLESLKELSSPMVKVKRDGQKLEIKSSEIVVGDVILVEAGDVIGADGRILESYSLKVNESSLTGEASEVEKNNRIINEEVALADRKNMVYTGSLVVYGRGEMVVTAVGMDTELGKIAGMINAVGDNKTPLQQNLDKFSKGLAIAIMIISAIVFALYLYRGTNPLDALMFAVALAVAAIPEALGSIVTIVQAIGTSKMARENAIIKDLKAVESLGCVSVVCSDKTGTLTKNKMTVKEIFTAGRNIKPEEIDLTKDVHRYLIYDAVIANDAILSNGKYIGDPTEYSLMEMADNVNLNQQKKLDTDFIRKWIDRMEEIPFDSDRKMMSVKCKLHGRETILTKGAPDLLIEKCIRVKHENKVVDMTINEKEQIVKAYEKFSDNGLRVLAFAYKETNHKLGLEEECDYTFIGLVAMADPLREETIPAVMDAKSAGIKTVMITGDHKTTAVAIAKEAGIYREGDMAITGLMLDKKDDEWLNENVENISVYARVSPENKIRIVKAWQNRGHITAMTGDGVNDAPALKKADVGIAMGITGTEVSKDAATMILADDNFATIIKAVANGRNVYRNIKNAILFLLSGNTAGVFSVLYTSIMGLPVPFAPVHLLFINLLTDSLPALAIGMEPADERLLDEKPRDPKTGIMTRDFIMTMIAEGVLIAVVTMTAYHIGIAGNPAKASTMAFATLTMARLFHGFNCRSKESIFEIGLGSNKYSLYAFAAGVCLLALVIFVPFLHSVFSVENLSATAIAQIIGLSFIPTVIIQLVKLCRNKKGE